MEPEYDNSEMQHIEVQLDGGAGSGVLQQCVQNEQVACKSKLS